MQSSPDRKKTLRPRYDIRTELLLVTLPTVVVLGIMWLTEALSQHPVLYTSLAASSFLIYLDP